MWQLAPASNIRFLSCSQIILGSFLTVIIHIADTFLTRSAENMSVLRLEKRVRACFAQGLNDSDHLGFEPSTLGLQGQIFNYK